MEGRGHRVGGRRRRRQNRLGLAGTFQHRLGQFLDEQRHAVGSLDNIGDGFRRKSRVARQSSHHRLAVAFAETIEHHTADMGLAAPGRMEFGTEGNQQQHGQLPDPVDGQIQQFSRRRIDPVNVLEHHQYRRAFAPQPRAGPMMASNNFSRFRAGLRLRPAAAFGKDSNSLKSAMSP